MDVAIILPNSCRKPSGGPKVVFEYANVLARHGHAVTIYYMMGNFLGVRPGLRKLPGPIKHFFGNIFVAFTPRWIRLEPVVRKKAIYSTADIGRHDVITATAIGTADYAQLSKDKCKKLTYFIQDFENWNFTDEQVFQSYAWGMTNITVARWLSDIVDQYAKEPSVCISNGVDERIFHLTEPLQARKAHTLAFHYRKPAYKGCRYALEAVRILEKTYPDLAVTVVSTHEAPADLPRSCRYVYNATPEQVAQINNSAAVFLCSSIQEGFGLPGLEAMACGCALVSSDYLGVHEYAQDGINALIVPAQDAQALANAVSCLFEDEALRIKIAQGGLETAAQHTMTEAAQKFEAALLSACRSENGVTGDREMQRNKLSDRK